MGRDERCVIITVSDGSGPPTAPSQRAVADRSVVHVPSRRHERSAADPRLTVTPPEQIPLDRLRVPAGFKVEL